ncbi:MULTISPECIES: protein kinase domain-containing protein [unclassified Coleofasciculus]|uniref:protein kinase domain-containing protein n=1 Tax=unclassified Coleofasciculus TaxID=2692782 RepID=UPI001881337B|nr:MULTISPECIES: protein kinase [unclassified Coleofasciculus]MBE9126283.1 protein kinase [Coleofasciculus sp. LEGE 07081]MBE9149202.1 protein kinase [Coleofasciculus sp. LEGE 07092]
MSAKVILIAITGNLKGQRFEFSDRTTCIIGRAKDCNPRFPNDKYNQTISRYHCLLDINPPAIRIRDFGSLHGTYVNGKIIGKRQRQQTPAEGALMEFPEYDLKEGDEIKLRNTVFRISIEGAKPLKVTPGVLQVMPTKQQLSVTSTGELQCSSTVVVAQIPDSYFPDIKGYTLLKWLGKGELGNVYLAHHDQSKELVALKVMRSQVSANTGAISRFLREMKKTKLLLHPNIIQLKAFGYSQGNFFFTMDYCNGGSVADLMRQRDGRLSVNEAMSITLQVLDGLEYAHRVNIPTVKRADDSRCIVHGLVHGDLNPTNIFLTDVGLGRIGKVAKYGIVKAFDLAGLRGLSMSGTQARTPAFMPRQQVIDFKDTKPEIDVWAVAACLYFMLTGQLPRDFVGQDPFLVVLQTKPVPIRQRDASIPRRLAEVIDLALMDCPQIYFKSAAALKRALESVL